MSSVKVYIAEFEGDPVRCAKRNVHSRSLEDVQVLNDGFELTPNYMNRLDMSTYLNDGEIEHVEMEEKTLTSINDEDEQTKVRIYSIALLACVSLQSPDII